MRDKLADSAVIRLLGDALVWYPPGSGDAPRPFGGADGMEQLTAADIASRRAGLVFAAPAWDIALRTVTFAPAEKRHITRALPYLLEEQFAAEVESLHFATRPLGRLSLGVAACSHERMREWEKHLATLPPTAVWIPEPLLLPWQPGEVCILLEERGVLVRSGENEGFGIDRELAASALGELASRGEFETVVVYGRNRETAGALLPEDFQGRMQWRTGGFGSALMLGEQKHPLNLRQGVYGPKLPYGKWWRQWRAAAALLAAAFSLHIAAAWATYERLADANLGVRQRIEEAYREAIPQGAMADPERQLSAKLASLRGEAGSGASFVALMDGASRALRQQEGARLGSVSFNDQLGEARFTVLLPDFRAVESLRADMERQGLAASMESSSAEGGQVRARLKVRLGSQ